MDEIWEIGYRVDGVTYSVNMVEGTKAEALEIADRKCEKYGYTLGYLKQISRVEADSYRAKGMPYFKC